MMLLDKHELTTRIKQLSAELGFDACGVAKADVLESDARYLKAWLHSGKHAEMAYMENYFDKRTDPRLLVEGAQSVVAVLLNYYPKEKQTGHLPQIAKYAYGKDYHELIKNKLHLLLKQIQQLTPEGQIWGRVFTDSAPVLERRWAVNAGLGWIGKNTSLINPRLGSFCFIGEIILNVELVYGEPMPDRCGSCSRCLEACPTGAIEKAQQLNAKRCISYLTIESKKPIPSEIKTLLGNRLYGCDTCMDVCPWNRFAKPTNNADLGPLNGITGMNKEQWLALSDDEFDLKFKLSPLRRAGLGKIKQTLMDCF